MRGITREMCRAAKVSNALDFAARPLQIGMGGCPWRVAVASMLMCRTQRAQAEPVLRRLLNKWPAPADLARAEGLEEVVKPCGLYRNRARQLPRFSSLWLSDGWTFLSELPGCGVYVTDSVGLFCFGMTELESVDYVLKGYVDALRCAGQGIR